MGTRANLNLSNSRGTSYSKITRLVLSMAASTEVDLLVCCSKIKQKSSSILKTDDIYSSISFCESEVTSSKAAQAG